MKNIPPAIIENIRHKETVLFIGSGFSRAAGLPSASAIASLLARKLKADGKSFDASTEKQLEKAADLFAATYGRGRLTAEVESFLKMAPQDDVSTSHRLLGSLVKHGFVKAIVTTNYDTLIEDGCAAVGASINVVAHESQLHSAAGDAAVLYKIHGDFAHPELLVLTSADMQRWSGQENRPIVRQLQALLDKNAFLYLGYSLSDVNILALLLGSDFSTRGAPRHKRFAALYSQENFDDTERLRQYGVDTFHADDTDGLLRSVLLQLSVKLKIKHLVFNYPSWYPDQQARYGGIETFIEYLRKYPGDCVHEVVPVYSQKMISYTPSSPAYSSSPTYPASFYYFKAGAKAAVEEVLDERRLGQSGMPDVVHMHFLAFAPLCEEAGLPTLCTSHSLLSLDLAYAKGVYDGVASEGGKQEVRAVYDAERTAASSARFVTVLSSAHEKEIRSFGARSILRVDAPFDPNCFQPESDPKGARFRAFLDDRFTITYVGRPDRRKGVEILIRACESLAQRDQNLQLLLVGYGFRHSAGTLAFGSGRFCFNTSLLENLGVKIQLRTAYNSIDAGVFYASSDIVVVPSLYEPMGYVVLEAMACARPVVASRVGGIVEMITDGQNGMLFEPGHADELTEKLIALHSDAEMRRRMGWQARQDVERRRAAADIVHDWQTLYRKAAFAFGESLYPDDELLQSIREKCERAKVWDMAVVLGDTQVQLVRSGVIDLYSTAVLGCNLAKETIAENPEKCFLPKGIPVDRALVRGIAHELQRALRRKGVTVSFSVTALCEVMTDLALALLNREVDISDGFCLSAEETMKRLDNFWFQKSFDVSRRSTAGG